MLHHRDATMIMITMIMRLGLETERGLSGKRRLITTAMGGENKNKKERYECGGSRRRETE